MSVRPNTITNIEHLDEHVQDLLIERALWGLGGAQETELAVAVADVDGTAFEFERVIGALCQGMLASEPEEMPAAMRERLGTIAATEAPVRASDRSATNASDGGASLRYVAESAEPAASSRAGSDVVGSGLSTGPLQWFGWVAAAACLTYAIFATTPEGGALPGGVAPALMSRVEAAGDVIRANWAGISAIGAADHALDLGVSGEVVWSDDLDEGFMRIDGIEPNDPSAFQYQLWIFDAERRTGDLPQFAADQISPLLTQRPVDGGVFDVTIADDGSVIVPIDAKLPVGKAAIFAVTKEQPGGVVVSDRDVVFLALRG